MSIYQLDAQYLFNLEKTCKAKKRSINTGLRFVSTIGIGSKLESRNDNVMGLPVFYKKL